MGLPEMVACDIAAVAGVIMYWALTAQSEDRNCGFRRSTRGVISMIGGTVEFVASSIVLFISRRVPSVSLNTPDRTTKNEVRDTTERHQQRS